ARDSLLSKGSPREIARRDGPLGNLPAVTRDDPTEQMQPMTDGASAAKTAPPEPPQAGAPDEADQSQHVRAAARRGRSRRARRNRLLQSGVLVEVIALWWVITAIELVDPLYLPSPQAVLGSFIDANLCLVVDESTGRTVCGVQNYYLWEHLIASLQRIGVGVSLAALSGIALGFLMSLWEPANTALAP